MHFAPAPRRRVPPLATAGGVLAVLTLTACTRPSAPVPSPDPVPWTDGKTGIEWVPVTAEYALSRTEVTVDEYARCVAAGACSDKLVGGVEWKEKPWAPSEQCNFGRDGLGPHPMNCVDWHDADAFCSWAGGRLVTKAEWRAEASESGRRIFPWGAERPTCDLAVMYETDAVVPVKGCGRKGTWPVCSKPKGNSLHGLCDMAGNVWEWTETKEFPGPETEPRYNLGGSFAQTPAYLESEYTLVNPTKFRIFHTGLRCRIAL